MLGFFMNALEGRGAFSLSTATKATVQSLPCGTPLVAVQSPTTLRETGLPTGMQFGILSENSRIICQRYIEGNMFTPRFRIERISLSEFCPRGWTLFRIQQAEDMFDLQKTYRKTKYTIGDVYQTLRSFPGDDFVAECLSNRMSSAIIQPCDCTGQHWWTPLHFKADELTKLLEDALGTAIPKLPGKSPNPVMLKLQHHGIAIESGWVIHFASCRVPDKTNQVKLDTLDTFCNITPYAEMGGACPYKTDTAHTRILHRNRAVWILFHAAEWGKYNILCNNCEHLCRMCKVGRKQSAQVKKKVGSLAIEAGTWAIPGGKIVKGIASFGLPFILEQLFPDHSSEDSAPAPFT